MSRSPDDLKSSQRAGRPLSGYRRQLAQLDRMLEDGESWSGNERNCVFLNLGTDDEADVRFATVSALTGLNFLEDARAYALVDWDQDGDVDIWTTNRTAPRLRLMRNEAANGHHFIALKLIGKSCNRDAIGARLELKMAGQQKPLTRTLRAGEGFLAQSSKWLHFGLGDASKVEALMIHWPGQAKAQIVRGMDVDSFYEITQDNRQPRQLRARPNLNSRLTSQPLELPASSDAAQILLTSRLPLPRLSIQRFDGTIDQLESFQGQPVWLSLWASWCAPCLQELQEVTSRAEQLRAAGVNVVALSLDGFEQPDVEPTSIKDAQRVMATLKFPFVSAAATAETIRRLQFADRQLFGRQSKTVLPASFLLSSDGQLAAVYRGPVSVDRLLEDAASLSKDERALTETALPFPGIWFDGRRRYAPIGIVADLIDHRAYDDAADYVRRYRADLSHQPGYVEVVGLLGTLLAKAEQVQDALQMYHWALEVDPNSVAVLNNMAWHLATHQDPSVRDPQLAIRQAEAAARLTKYRSASILDTLALCYAAAQQVDRARETFDRAIQLALETEQSELAERLKEKRSHLGSEGQK